MRWIWIDKILEFRSGEYAKAVKNLTLAEEHLHDHLPGYPAMPASLIIEGLAQTGGILVGEAKNFAEKVVLAKIPKAEFFGVACAGDQLTYEVRLTALRSEGAVVLGRAFLDDQLLAEVEIFFAHLDQSRSNQMFGPKNFVFTQQLLGVLDLAKARERSRSDPAASDADGLNAEQAGDGSPTPAASEAKTKTKTEAEAEAGAGAEAERPDRAKAGTGSGTERD